MTMEQPYEPEGEVDFVGRTSAQLAANGVDRADRLDALQLLAILDASADVSGRVRRPLDDLAGEFELPLVDVLRSLEHLENAGAIDRDGGAVLLRDREEDGVGGLHLADFLDDVRASFDDRQPEVVRPDRWLARAGASLAVAAAVLAILALAPSSPSTPTPVAAGSTSSSAATGDSPTTSAGVRPDLADDAAPDLELPTTLAPATTSLPDATIAATGCPSGAPIIRAVGGVIAIANPTERDVEVSALRVGDAVLTFEPIVVAAGESVAPPVTIPPGTPAEDVEIDRWEWQDTDCG